MWRRHKTKPHLCHLKSDHMRHAIAAIKPHMVSGQPVGQLFWCYFPVIHCMRVCVCVSFAWAARGTRDVDRLSSPPLPLSRCLSMQLDCGAASAPCSLSPSLSLHQQRWHNWFKSLILPAGAILLLFSIAFLLFFNFFFGLQLSLM